MNGLIYVRVSTDEQAKHGVSLDSQLKECRVTALKRGTKILQEFREEGVSAKTIKRPELLKLLAYCHDHKSEIDEVIIWKVDRFSRNTTDYLYLKTTLHKLGIKVVSATQPIEDTSTGQLLFVYVSSSYQ